MKKENQQKLKISKEKQISSILIILLTFSFILFSSSYSTIASVQDEADKKQTLNKVYPLQVPSKENKGQIQTKSGQKHIEAPFQRYLEQIRQQDIKRKERIKIEQADLTPPTSPSFIEAKSQNYFSIMAEWGESEDPESGIDYYAYAIGTGTGTYSEMGNVKWWQSTSLKRKATAYIDLDPTKTYYVSVNAANGSGLYSEIISSEPIIPFWEDIGQEGNKIEVVFADYGWDKDGNIIEGWSDEQKAVMGEFVNKMYPIIEELYGIPATNYTLTIVRDLYYSGSNIFIPSLDEVHMDDSFYPQLFTHELIHAFRNDYTVTSDGSWYYNSTLSGFEEGFAQGVSYECMNRYIELYPDDEIVNTNVIWLSDYDWDYDFQNVDELRGTDFWSAYAGVSLNWRRYEMAAAAMRKIYIESPGFYKSFNQEYFTRLNSDHDLRSSRELMVDIIESITPTIEGINTAEWIDSQHVFHCQNVFGKKIWHRIQDYPSHEFWVFQSLYFLETMGCGSEWVCWDSDQQKYVYHDLNGSLGEAKLFNWNNEKIWEDSLLIEPTTNPDEPEGYMGFGSDEKNLTTASTQYPWPEGDDDDFVFNLDDLGIYRFEATFVEEETGDSVTNSIYRVLGEEISSNFKGVWGGVIGHKEGIIYLNHEDFSNEESLEVHNGAFYGERTWAGVSNEKTGYYDSVPGKVFITFVDAEKGKIYHAQRNIDYGSWNGNQMLLVNVQQAILAQYTIVPISHDFGSVNVYGTTASQTFSITNIGTNNPVMGTLSITGPDASEFGIQNDNCSGQTIAPSESCTVDVVFSPTSEGSKTANLSIPSSDPYSPTLTVTLTGEGFIIKPTISGSVKTSEGVGIEGVTITSSDGGGTTTTDSNGNYSHTVSYGWSGTVTPSKEDYSFTPSIRDYTDITTDQTNQDYTANPYSSSVSIKYPQNGATVWGTLTIQAEASSAAQGASIQAITGVGFYIDGTKVGEATTSPYEYSWDTTEVSDGTHTIKVKATNASGQTAEHEITVTVNNSPPQISLNRNRLNFGSTAGTTTSNQTLLLSNSGGSALNWTAMPSENWIQVSPTSGTGTSVLSVSVDPTGLAAAAYKAAGTYTGTITVTDPSASNSPQTINVTLTVMSQSATSLPFGYYDTPIDGTTGITGAIAVTGWALDDIEVTKLEIKRDAHPSDSPGAIGRDGLVYIGDAVFVEGPRPDIEQAYSTYPFNYRAGWGYMLLTNFLPNQGNGTYRIHALVYDKEGHMVSLGTKTITCDNANAILPFGTIDTPGQGGEASGSSYINWAWALTPQPNSIPTDGSTILVWVDGVPVGNVYEYNLYRADIATLFPGFANTDGAVGYYYLDTTQYPNGVYTIAWSVEDSAGNVQGLGSRYFTIINTEAVAAAQAGMMSRRKDLGTPLSIEVVDNLPVCFEPVRVRRGYSRDEEPEIRDADINGVVHIEIREVERVEVELGKGVYTGYMVVGSQHRPLPIGSTLDASTGTFSWQPGPGFIGEYELIFIKGERNGEQRKIRVTVRILPKFNNH